MYDIIQDLIPNLPQTPFRNGVGAYEGVVAHATANYGDTAQGERSWEGRTFNDAFVHFFVDSTEIRQVASTDYVAWGAGPQANPRFLHVELCQTKNDGSAGAAVKFKEAYNRYVWLLGSLLFQRKLGVTDATLWSHKRVSNELGGTDHQDPDDYLAEWGKTWDNVKNDVLYVYNVLSTPPVDIRKLKLKEIANEIDFMLTLVPKGDGNAEWALNWGAQVYDIMNSQNLVNKI